MTDQDPQFKYLIHCDGTGQEVDEKAEAEQGDVTLVEEGDENGDVRDMIKSGEDESEEELECLQIFQVCLGLLNCLDRCVSSTI